MSATVHKVVRTVGVADQVAYTATVTYSEEDHGVTYETAFVGFTYGKPGTVMMVSLPFSGEPVTNPRRFGDRLDESWVRAFYAEPSGQ